jgi:hypothetical protein
MVKKILPLIILVLFTTQLVAQGISRSTGIGIRYTVWKPNDPVGSIDVGYATATVVSGSAEGGELYFFTRLKDRWFLETSIGGTGMIAVVKAGTSGTYSGFSSITPFLFGARYDFLSPEYGSAFQPYFSFGGGIHWINREATTSGTGGAYVGTEKNTQFGLFGGGGLNVVLTKWLALNADLKYHLLNFNPDADYTGLQFGLGFSIMWGSEQEIFRVEEIKLVVKDIYPAYYRFYNTYPLALVTIKNMASYPIEINLYSNIQGYSERSQESGFIRIAAGNSEDIPVYALFGSKLLNVSQREPAVIDIQLEARAGATHTRTISANIIIHSRNAWNGEIDRLGFFITPDNETIMEFSRNIVRELPDVHQTEVRNFESAKVIFNTLKKARIRYQSDPNIPYYKDDYVQFATETLEKSVGDCDDLVVLYSSLLESIGIKTAFIEVRDPEKEIAHLYLMFDTGIEADKGYLVTSNQKWYVIREKTPERKTLWIPVETTLVEQGFDQAWQAGAMAYLQEGTLRAGIAQGWMRVIDVE